MEFYGTSVKPKAVLRKRDGTSFYEVIFTSRPLLVTVTSSINHLNGYITSCNELCTVKDKIVPNSKIISVNRTLVEGLVVSDIAMYLRKASLPLRLTLVHPDGLTADEVPDNQPEVYMVRDKLSEAERSAVVPYKSR